MTDHELTSDDIAKLQAIKKEFAKRANEGDDE